MSGQVEHAAGVRSGDFPSRWGTPVGTPASEERAAWIRRNVLVEQARNLDLDVRARRALLVHQDAPTDARLALEAARALELQALEPRG